MDYITHAKRDDFGDWAKPHGLEDHLIQIAHLSQEYAPRLIAGSV